MTIDRTLADACYRTHFGAFACRAFEALNPGQRLIPNWHIDTICHQIQQMVAGAARKRLVLNLPPRTLKSFLVSGGPAGLVAGAQSRHPDHLRQLLRRTRQQVLPGLPRSAGHAFL
jgi:hypothetical protein